jgi:hypothetical protein
VCIVGLIVGVCNRRGGIVPRTYASAGIFYLAQHCFLFVLRGGVALSVIAVIRFWMSDWMNDRWKLRWR